ncbi:cytochrome b/b6 domain-containing protein [Devosia algicola]|uniref:Cytochrome b/b6 domain-containing protein n=1 Tax=Devosia algicola TaxID=3026418 RepID=A0ABY7YKY9_9HYPH|nr:cytochrome b/b6 domain-containing protein [Devosia algicola]WDR01864.1 cytochrome b/b6 domain-containing protein [Devosia algicola]
MSGAVDIRDEGASLRISLGILLAAIFVAQLGWRRLGGRRLLRERRDISHYLAVAMHWTLYALLAAQIGFGFSLRWFRGGSFTFFGLFSMPPLIGADRGLARVVENLHNIAAWTIIYLVGLHALAALAHHYVLRDGVLGRMVPTTVRRLARDDRTS